MTHTQANFGQQLGIILAQQLEDKTKEAKKQEVWPLQVLSW